MEEEGWEARYLLVRAVLNDEVYCDLKSGVLRPEVRIATGGSGIVQFGVERRG